VCRVRASTCAVRAFACACACAASCPSFPCGRKKSRCHMSERRQVVHPMCPMMTDDDQRAYDFSTRSSDALCARCHLTTRVVRFGVACDRAVGCHWAWIHVVGRAWRAWGCRFVFHDDDDDDGDDRARAVRACVRARTHIYTHT